MSKIVILGLGYVGEELVNIFQSSENEVIAIDNQIYGNRVKKVIDKGAKFYQRDIFNTKDIIKDAEIVINTVSVTNVPRSKEESNSEIDNLIYKLGTEANRYVLEHITGKLVFLSSHVIFEGYKNKFNITEQIEPAPLLAYSRSKRQSELDIINSGKDFLILRLGSSYGYNDSVRMNIVSNILAFKAATEKKVIISNINSYKPIVGTYDVARAIEHLIHIKKNKEIYHLVNENIQIKNIAQICKKYVKNLKIEKTGDHNILNYTLSNQKLLETDFVFLQNLDMEINIMIEAWSN